MFSWRAGNALLNGIETKKAENRVTSLWIAMRGLALIQYKCVQIASLCFSSLGLDSPFEPFKRMTDKTLFTLFELSDNQAPTGFAQAQLKLLYKEHHPFTELRKSVSELERQLDLEQNSSDLLRRVMERASELVQNQDSVSDLRSPRHSGRNIATSQLSPRTTSAPPGPLKNSPSIKKTQGHQTERSSSVRPTALSTQKSTVRQLLSVADTVSQKNSPKSQSTENSPKFVNSLSEEAGKDSLEYTLHSVDSQQKEVKKNLESVNVSGSISESSYNQTPHDSSTADPAQEANDSKTKSEKNDEKQDPEAEKETRVELFMALFKGMTGPEWIEHIIDLTFVDLDLEKVPSLQLKDQKEQLRRFDSLPEETERVYAAFTAKLQSVLKGSNILVTSLFQKEEDSSSSKGEQVQLWPALNQALKHSKKADGEAEQEVLQWMTEMHEKEARLAKIATDIQINKELEERYVICCFL